MLCQGILVCGVVVPGGDGPSEGYEMMGKSVRAVLFVTLAVALLPGRVSGAKGYDKARPPPSPTLP